MDFLAVPCQLDLGFMDQRAVPQSGSKKSAALEGNGKTPLHQS